MSAQTTLRLDRLSLKNFRCFTECELDLHPELTVLVACNGQGKTALLDAIAILLGLFVDSFKETKHAFGFARADAHLTSRGGDTMEPVVPVVLSVEGWARGHKIAWRHKIVALGKEKSVLVRSEAGDLQSLAHGLRGLLEHTAKNPDDGVPLLPVVAYYGTGRLWSEHHLTQAKRRAEATVKGRLAGYRDCLSPSSSFKVFADWYGETWRSMGAPRVPGLEVPDRPERLIAAVESAVKTVLEPTGWHGLEYVNGHLFVRHAEHGRLLLSLLSDGVRNMIALVADLAQKCVRLNPHLGDEATQKTPGVVLIDEVDMHLHPGWQQTVIALLRRAFPEVQLILSTHSPQVLSSVHRESIRTVRLLAERGVLETPRFQTRGVESADVLTHIMGIDPVPQVEEARLLSEYRALIEDGEFESPAARALRERLIEHFSAGHPLMLDCDRLIRFQAFKLRRSAATAPAEPR